MSKTTLDLSTLSDISDGTHTIKVKAKADGYRDSEFSNEVEWTKSSSYSGIVTNNSNGRVSINIYVDQVYKQSLAVGNSTPVEGGVVRLSTPDALKEGWTIVSNTNCTYVKTETDVTVTPTATNFTINAYAN